MSEFAARLAYPRLAKWTLVGAALFLSSGVVALAGPIAEWFVLVAALLKYLGASLFVMGGFFYLLYWSVDHGPDFVRRLRT